MGDVHSRPKGVALRTLAQRSLVLLSLFILAVTILTVLATVALAATQVVQLAKLTAADAALNDQFGWSVAVDGDSAIVGAKSKPTNGMEYSGAAYIFERTGFSWSQKALLTPSDGAAYDFFGEAVALDGDTAVVAASHKDTQRGAVYIFVRQANGSWIQQAELAAADGVAYDKFGWSVAIDGETVLVGAINKSMGGPDGQGAVYIFTRSGSSWTQQAELTETASATYQYFGSAVVIDGDTALIGAYGASPGGSDRQGAAYVFTRAGSSWTHRAELTESGESRTNFGYGVALDGDTALIGAYRATVSGHVDQGTAFVFTGSGSAWARQAVLVATDGTAGDWFGKTVAVEGDTALVGASAAGVGGNAAQGAGYVFARSGGSWSQQSKVTASDGTTYSALGSSVALSGRTALVGSPGQTAAAYVLGLPCTITPIITAGLGSITPATVQTYDYGSKPLFTFAPEPGYVIGEVRVDGGVVGLNGTGQYGFSQLTADHTISVTFAPLAKPVLNKLSRRSGKRGVTVTLTGRQFGSVRGTSYVKFGKAKATKYVSWSDGKLKVKVPKKAKSGKVKVTVTTAGGTSATKMFRVKR
jgi:hypothetical protein